MRAGQTLLRSLKAQVPPRGTQLCIPVGEPTQAWLRPVATTRDALSQDDARVLTLWRNRFVGSFQHEFEATDARTADWLTESVGPDDSRILFMLDDAQGRAFGYMGLAFIDWTRGSVEADAIVRGETAPHGLMSRALHTLLAWARIQLGLPEAGVRVRSDNPALEFYRKMGFVETSQVPLRRTVEPDGVKWVEDLSLPAGTEPSLVHMRYRVPNIF
jgi:RimJ/RimL family protein N-acetyltransferase